jgi:hypothetical protein
LIPTTALVRACLSPTGFVIPALRAGVFDSNFGGGHDMKNQGESPESVGVAAWAARLSACSRDELRVVDRVLSGLEQGRSVYGPLDISRDPRSFIAEAAQEARDLLVYLAAHEIAKEDAEREIAAPRCSCGDVPSLRHLDDDGHLPGCEVRR